MKPLKFSGGGRYKYRVFAPPGYDDCERRKPHYFESKDKAQSVRPDHLEAITAFENGGQRFRDRTHCKNGHEFNMENTNYRKDRRQCRVCGRNAMRRYRMRGEGC